MSRRRRTKARPAALTSLPSTAVRHQERHPARAKVDGSTGQAFKAVAGDRTIAEVLGEMVTRRVQRHHALQAEAGTISDPDLLAALDRAIEARTDLGHLIDRIERRLDHANVPPARPAGPAHP